MSFLSTEWVKYDYTVSYLQGHVIWLSARASKLPRWAQISYVFEIPVWITFFLSIILTNLVWVTLAHYQNRELKKTHLIFAIYGILIQTTHPKPNAIPIRSLYVTWIWCTMVIAGSFNGVFFSLLSTKAVYGQEIQSIEEAVTTPGTKYIFTEFQSEAHVSSYTTEERRVMKSNRISCGSTILCLNIVSKEKHIFLMGPENILRVYLPKYVGRSGNQLLYSIKRPIKTMDYRMLLRTGYPLTELLDVWFQRMVEVGLFNLWEGRFTMYYAMRRQDSKSRTTAEPLGFEHLLIAFMLLIGGNLLSLCIFILEKVSMLRFKLKLWARHK